MDWASCNCWVICNNISEHDNKHIYPSIPVNVYTVSWFVTDVKRFDLLFCVLVCHQQVSIAYHVMHTAVEIHILAIHARFFFHAQSRFAEKRSPVMHGRHRHNICSGAMV